MSDTASNKTVFFQDLHQFFKFSEKALLRRFRSSIELGEVPKEINEIKTFERILIEMREEDILNYLRKVFKKHDNKFFTLLEDDFWLSEVNMFITYTSRSNKNKKKTLTFPLKLVFESAKVLEKKAKDFIGDLSKNLASEEVKEELEIKSYLNYYFLKLKYHISDEEEKKGLLQILAKLEKEIKIETSVQIPQFKVNKNIFSSVFNLAENVLKGAGINIPENAPKPTEEDFTNMIEMITKNDQVQNMIKNLASNLKNSTSSDQMFQEFSKQVTNPEIINTIKDLAEKNVKK
jgi:hypothetical protein